MRNDCRWTLSPGAAEPVQSAAAAQEWIERFSPARRPGTNHSLSQRVQTTAATGAERIRIYFRTYSNKSIYIYGTDFQIQFSSSTIPGSDATDWSAIFFASGA